MSDSTKIQWTDATWNPTRGCSKIAPGCAHCYAETFAERWRGVPGHAYELGFDPRIAPEQLTVPLKWKKPRRIFVDSMSDLFHESFSFNYIAKCFGVMALASWHTFQILTKRPQRAVEFFSWMEAQHSPDGNMNLRPQTVLLLAIADVPDIRLDHVMATLRSVDPTGWPLPNVHIGTSIANQTDADKNIPHLLQIPAAVRFLSVEPLIGPVNLDVKIACGVRPLYCACSAPCDHKKVDWVIVGGESGPGARPCNVNWIRSIVEQCKAAGVPVFVKQLGAVALDDQVSGLIGAAVPLRPDGSTKIYKLRDRKGGDSNEWPADLRIREFPKG